MRERGKQEEEKQEREPKRDNYENYYSATSTILSHDQILHSSSQLIISINHKQLTQPIQIGGDFCCCQFCLNYAVSLATFAERYISIECTLPQFGNVQQRKSSQNNSFLHILNDTNYKQFDFSLRGLSILYRITHIAKNKQSTQRERNERQNKSIEEAAIQRQKKEFCIGTKWQGFNFEVSIHAWSWTWSPLIHTYYSTTTMNTHYILTFVISKLTEWQKKTAVKTATTFEHWTQHSGWFFF